MDDSKLRPKAVLEYIAVLRQFFIHVVHSVPAVNKALAVWSLGLLHLLCIFRFGASTYITQTWQRRLQALGINPSTYTFEFFQCTAVTYLKLPFHPPPLSSNPKYKQSGRFYIGSTSIGMAKREFNRMAKFKLAREGNPVHVELAVKYWSRRSDFFQYTAIPIASFSTYQEAWVFEHLLISRWQPPLNHPFITKILTLKTSGWMVQYKKHSQHFPSVPEGQRLFQRLRRRLTTRAIPTSVQCKQQHAWNILFQLTSPGKISFDTSRDLRSGKYDDWEIYAIFRLCNHLEQPTRGTAKKLLSSAMTFRNMTIPKKNRPASMIFLAHSDFSSQIGKFLKQHVQRYKHLAIPLHLPTAKMRETAAQKLSQFLHNHRALELRLPVHDPDRLSCTCSTLKTIIDRFDLSQHCFGDNQHIAVGFQDLRFPNKLKMFKDANASSTIFPGLAQFRKEWYDALQRWTAHHGFPPFSDHDLEQELQKQWAQHIHELEQNPRFTFHSVKHLLQWLPKDVVIHHADHELHRLTLFCSQLYFASALNTWDDPQLFSRYDGTEHQAIQVINSALSIHLQRKYKWGVKQSSTLPYGFVHLKKKKMYSKGRTLISYFGSRYASLMQATARTLDTLCMLLWPQDAGQLPVPEIWKRIHQLFKDTDYSIQFGSINDDLVGFFNSVPQSRLLSAIHSIIEEWKRQHGDTQVSVDMALKGPNKHTTFLGQFKKKANTNVKTVQVSDILSIVQASLKTHIFKAVNQIWIQHRGAGIGAHISPSLSNLAVTMIERSWSQSYPLFLESSRLHWLFTRYVDNRFILFNDQFRDHLPIKILSDNFFYEAPVELEPVEDGSLLGFTIDPILRTIRYQVPPIWKIRDLKSAGSLRLRLSGLKSRSVLIRRYTFPKDHIHEDLHLLIQLYVQKGFSFADCYRTVYSKPPSSKKP